MCIKITLQRQLSNLEVWGFYIHWRFFRSGTVERIGDALDQLVFPLGDLIGVNIELLGQFDEGFIAFDGDQKADE
jgi:hypothetical protein